MGEIRILLADDHAVVRAGLRNALEENPEVEVIGEVGDGPALFAALAAMRPDCLLLDVTMPDFEPIAAIREIRALHPDMKILVISAYDDDVYVQGLLRAGVNGYHLKDQPLGDLRLAVQRVLSGERWVSSSLIDKLVASTDAPVAATKLTPRQQDVLRLLQDGLDNRGIAQQLGLSVKTVENHLTRLYRNLGVQSRLEAVHYARKHPKVLAAPGEMPVRSSDTSEPIVQERIKVLLVDDNARYRHQLRRMIGKMCPRAVLYEAATIEDAIEQTRRVAPQLALVDVVLGEEDGIRCTRRIKKLSPESRIVLISAYPDREFHRLGLEAGAVAFLDKKDLDAAVLRQIVSDTIA